MCYDHRYPFMFPVDGVMPGIDPVRAKGIRRTAREISGRVPGLRGFYNARLGNILFCYGAEPAGGPLALEPRPYASHEIDTVVEFAQMGRASRAEKDHIAAKNAEREKWAQADHMESRLAERRPDALSYAGFRDRKRRGVEKMVSAL